MMVNWYDGAGAIMLTMVALVAMVMLVRKR